MRPKNSVIKRQQARRKKNKKAILFVKLFDNRGNELDPKSFRNRAACITQTLYRNNVEVKVPALTLLGSVRVHIRWKHGNEVKNLEFMRFEGSSWDGASIPKYLQTLFGDPFQKSQWRPSFVHDYMYALQVDREIADEAYLYLMQQEEDLNISWIKEQLMYAGVRLGGWTRYTSAYNKVGVAHKVAKFLGKWF